MASVKKGQLAGPGEWAKHLNRVAPGFWHRERAIERLISFLRGNAPTTSKIGGDETMARHNHLSAIPRLRNRPVEVLEPWEHISFPNRIVMPLSNEYLDNQVGGESCRSFVDRICRDYVDLNPRGLAQYQIESDWDESGFTSIFVGFIVTFAFEEVNDAVMFKLRFWERD